MLVLRQPDFYYFNVRELTMSSPIDNAVRIFNERFGSAPAYAAAAPGRVEILGNHTDYNGGLVLAAALDTFTVVAVSKTNTNEINLIAADLNAQAIVDISHIVETILGELCAGSRGSAYQERSEAGRV
jgi:galactokinase